MAANNKVKLLYILGAARSGSTLLNRLLGHISGFFSMGEVKAIWEMVGGDGVLCECGIPLKSCPFWTAVFHRALGGVENIDPRMDQLRSSKFRLRWLPLLLWPRISRKYQEEIQYYSRVVSAIGRAAQEVSGCRVLVDSSKFNQDCIVLNRIREFDLHVVHLVRDSRAVAHSWLRKKQRPQFSLRPEFMPQIGVKASAREWLLTNALSEALRPCLKHYTRIYYEDLVADPRTTITRICSAVGEPKPALEFLEGQTAHLGKGHTIAGNPMRFQNGSVPIRPDMEWVERLSKDQKAVVTRITWPLLQYYGYFRRGGTCGDRGGVSPAAERCTAEMRPIALSESQLRG